ncbi:reverse transcriptase domain-containing protein [Aliarcobacter butzleri]|uniref:reverse transcriptase domain-containing protein n=1 Tax=Aliarcobacter butzleri TaxID=28197 RepID=UPI000F4A1B30|nr:reverse transcriptase domain-containing protein [Aliarcobacter butzleri]
MNYPFKIFNRNIKIKNIKKVFEDSIQHKPSIGIDGINIKSFEIIKDIEFNIINKKIVNKTYNFSFYKEKLISKGRMKYPRVLSIPTIRDKIVLKIIYNTLLEIYQNELSNELIHTKIDKITKTILSKKYDSYIKIDIENFYPSINHDILMKAINKKTKKSEFITLLKKAITQETVNKNHSLEKYTNNTGVPQGLSISNILASIYLIEFDKKYSTENEFEYYRYVDDILILCNKNSIYKIFESLKNDMKNLKLTIHELGINEEKTSYGDLKKGFYFLGYSYKEKFISVRKSSINNLYNSIINIFTQYKHSKEKNINFLYWKLNLKITGCKFEGKKYGWLYFFSQINDTKLLFKIDIFIQEMFKKFKIEYDRKKVKKFIRTHFEILKNRTNTKYIPNFSELTVEEKKEILANIFSLKDIKVSQVEYRFNKLIYKNIKEMEKDIQMY